MDPASGRADDMKMVNLRDVVVKITSRILHTLRTSTDLYSENHGSI